MFAIGDGDKQNRTSCKSTKQGFLVNGGVLLAGLKKGEIRRLHSFRGTTIHVSKAWIVVDKPARQERKRKKELPSLTSNKHRSEVSI
ncbi:hypothetical protein ANTQUA_LOCUS9435 [Anthophora quadrimaculata]